MSDLRRKSIPRKRLGFVPPTCLQHHADLLILYTALKMILLSSQFERDVSLLIMPGGLTRAVHLIHTKGMLGTQRTGTDLAHRDPQSQV
jgi:hypothetical protein